MEKSGKVRISPFTWVFLVLAVIMAIMAVYFFQDAMKYINEYAESYGITVKDMGPDAIKYVLNAFLPYCIYTLIMLGFAAALYEISKLRASLYEEPEIEGYLAAAALAAETEGAAEAEAVEAEAEEVVEAAEVGTEDAGEEVAAAFEAAEEAVDEAEVVVAEAEEAVEAEAEEVVEACEEAEVVAETAAEEVIEAAEDAAIDEKVKD